MTLSCFGAGSLSAGAFPVAWRGPKPRMNGDPRRWCLPGLEGSWPAGARAWHYRRWRLRHRHRVCVCHRAGLHDLACKGGPEVMRRMFSLRVMRGVFVLSLGFWSRETFPSTSRDQSLSRAAAWRGASAHSSSWKLNLAWP